MSLERLETPRRQKTQDLVGSRADLPDKRSTIRSMEQHDRDSTLTPRVTTHEIKGEGHKATPTKSSGNRCSCRTQAIPHANMSSSTRANNLSIEPNRMFTFAR